MASKTGWTWESPERVLEFLVRHDVLQDEPDREGLPRVTVRVDECPETMTRAELKEKMKSGWQVRDYNHTSVSQVCDASDEHGEAWSVCWDCDGIPALIGIRLRDITHARPHDEVEWIRIAASAAGDGGDEA